LRERRRQFSAHAKPWLTSKGVHLTNSQTSVPRAIDEIKVSD
jgi:hypothetical protein